MASDDLIARVEQILHQAAETHHAVYAITDGVDDDWATWYSEWLTSLSELPDLLGGVVRSELTYMLVLLDDEYLREDPGVGWERYYAQRLVERFAG